MRYPAIKALTAEESIRIGKDMLREEQPRLDTTRVTTGCGGSGTETKTYMHRDLGSQELSWEKIQSSIELPLATKSQDNNSVLMDLAEVFNGVEPVEHDVLNLQQYFFPMRHSDA